MDTPAETQTENLYRMACDKVLARMSKVMKTIHEVGVLPTGFEAHYGDILCDLAEIQGFLYRICAAGVNRDTDSYLLIINEDFKEVSK